MKCEEAQHLIYTTDDISRESQSGLMMHVATCRTCAQVLDSFENVQAGIADLALQEDGPVDAARLTAKIMSGINDAHKPAHTTGFWTWRYFRLALGVLSLILVTGFVHEQYIGSNNPGYHQNGKTILSHAGGSATLRNQTEKRASLHALVQARNINSKKLK